MMSGKQSVPGTEEAWEEGELGLSLEHAKKADAAVVAAVDESLGLQMISIRLDKSLIEVYKLLADYHGVGYQPLMRDALKRFAECEMKAILVGAVESQKEQKSKAKARARGKSVTPEDSPKKAA
jgi:uncharacterized protein (DUF4415 family)